MNITGLNTTALIGPWFLLIQIVIYYVQENGKEWKNGAHKKCNFWHSTNGLICRLFHSTKDHGR